MPAESGNAASSVGTTSLAYSFAPFNPRFSLATGTAAFAAGLREFDLQPVDFSGEAGFVGPDVGHDGGFSEI
ncbi:hypothetical protein [Paraburkholderia sp. RL17-337-BIB-A]|uniref:hypothetical protein n=1 Tax=Paraburkholderia sp. RL17-337-BIB-A TaxID=3031636 RepID=UPI0038BAAABB